MQSIGERLEEARKRKGISLSEAAEATKIRIDFLKNIEQNQLDFDLPEIYKRGFVKNYANYLALDSKSILADYTAQLLSASPGSTKAGNSEFFGSMEVKPGSEDTKKSNLGKLSKKRKINETNEDAYQNKEIDKAFYLKVSLVVTGVLVFFFVIIGLVSAILNSGDEPEITGAGLNNQLKAVTTAQDADTRPTGSSKEKVSLIASGNVYVLVKQRNDNKELVRKTLSAGDTLDFMKQGPVDILFTAGENLVIVNPSGERLRPKGEGTAKISIP